MSAQFHNEGMPRLHRCKLCRVRSRHISPHFIAACGKKIGQEHGALRPADIGRLTLVVHWIGLVQSVYRMHRAVFRKSCA